MHACVCARPTVCPHMWLQSRWHVRTHVCIANGTHARVSAKPSVYMRGFQGYQMHASVGTKLTACAHACVPGGDVDGITAAWDAPQQVVSGCQGHLVKFHACVLKTALQGHTSKRTTHHALMLPHRCVIIHSDKWYMSTELATSHMDVSSTKKLKCVLRIPTPGSSWARQEGHASKQGHRACTACLHLRSLLQMPQPTSHEASTRPDGSFHGCRQCPYFLLLLPRLCLRS